MKYLQGMCRVTPPSMETRLSNIEATQRSMQSTLADLSSSVAQLVQLLTSADVKRGEKVSQDKCSYDQSLKKQKPDDDEEGKEIRERNSGKQIVLQIRDKGNLLMLKGV